MPTPACSLLQLLRHKRPTEAFERLRRIAVHKCNRTQLGLAPGQTGMWFAPLSWDYEVEVEASREARPHQSTSVTSIRIVKTDRLPDGDITRMTPVLTLLKAKTPKAEAVATIYTDPDELKKASAALKAYPGRNAIRQQITQRANTAARL